MRSLLVCYAIVSLLQHNFSNSAVQPFHCCNAVSHCLLLQLYPTITLAFTACSTGFYGLRFFSFQPVFLAHWPFSFSLCCLQHLLIDLQILAQWSCNISFFRLHFFTSQLAILSVLALSIFPFVVCNIGKSAYEYLL